MRNLAFVTCIVAAAAPAFGEPADFARQLMNCQPSCYQIQPVGNDQRAQPHTGCGYLDYTVVERAPAKSNRWSRAKIDGVPAASATEVKDCKFPAQSGGPWASVLAQVKPDLPGLERDARLVIPTGEQWDEQEDSDDPRFKIRRVTLRIYSKHYQLQPNECGAYGNTVCEFGNTGRKVPLAINEAHFRLDEAKQLAAANKLDGCRIDAWQVARIAKAMTRFRDKHVKDDDWVKDRTYRTRFDGDLDEKAVFDKLAAFAQDAEPLFERCSKGQKLDVSDASADRY